MKLFNKFRFDIFKLVVLIISSIYFVNIAFNPSSWNFFDGVNLIIHESGHFILGILGNEFLAVAGGTIMQILIPLAFVIYFFRTGQKFSASLTIFWIGASILNVSVYMADAEVMQLPLLGGDGTIHDWNYLLGHIGLLSFTSGIAFVVRSLGILVIFAAIISGLLYARKLEVDHVLNGFPRTGNDNRINSLS